MPTARVGDDDYPRFVAAALAIAAITESEAEDQLERHALARRAAINGNPFIDEHDFAREGDA